MGSLTEYLADRACVKIIDYLLDASSDLSKTQIAKACSISKATLFNHWEKLETLGLVKVTRKFGKTKLYQADRENPVVKKLLELKALLQEAKKPLVKVEEKPSQASAS